MSTSSKDPQINELFTEGSHHRNLSVIAINQNLYYNKDPTQRRNCHYVILFNNPIDQQQVMTLSRQMYPENPQHLMRNFREATSKPYGYLLIDLKPFTPENKRLHCNPFQHVTDPPKKMDYSRNTPQKMDQSTRLERDQSADQCRRVLIKLIILGNIADFYFKAWYKPITTWCVTVTNTASGYWRKKICRRFQLFRNWWNVPGLTTRENTMT